VAVLDDTDKLFAYYQGFVRDLNKSEDADLKSLTLELTAGLASDREKLKAIYYWVKDNIKYIAFENGYEGFIPREASVVFQRKFGDCKDMSSIITAMAGYAGIKNVNLSWIGTRNIPYSYGQLATPAVDDHMIATYADGNETIFLDATDKQTRFGLPSAFIQSKEALINNGSGYRIVTVPVVPAASNLTAESVTMKIDGGRLTGSGTVSREGHVRGFYLEQLGDAKGKVRQEMVKSIVEKGNNKFKLLKYDEANITDRDKPYTINYDFELDNYLVTLDNEIYVNLFLDKLYEKHTIEKDRKSKFEFDFLTAQQSEFALQVPAGYSVKYVPKNFSEDNALLKCNIAYEQQAGVLTLRFRIEIKKLLMDMSDFELWNETIKKLKSQYNETVILTKNK
jgi:hypothetical protein